MCRDALYFYAISSNVKCLFLFKVTILRLSSNCRTGIFLPVKSATCPAITYRQLFSAVFLVKIKIAFLRMHFATEEILIIYIERNETRGLANCRTGDNVLLRTETWIINQSRNIVIRTRLGDILRNLIRRSLSGPPEKFGPHFGPSRGPTAPLRHYAEPGPLSEDTHSAKRIFGRLLSALMTGYSLRSARHVGFPPINVAISRIHRMRAYSAIGW